ncbi:MAG: molybdenum cofactor guanylyltransferase [Desulfobacteraceae bacterium]|nr:molybdenum cofactor guanylyltransferase [Desulfobacteraceae bacterium]
MILRKAQTDRFTCSAVILSGGLNSRMGGKNKAFLKIGGLTILDRLIHTLSPFFSEILLVTREPGLYSGVKVKVVTDIFEYRASLAGIHAGLCKCKSDFAFIVPCDAPFIDPELVRYVLNQAKSCFDIIAPQIRGRFEPLCAVYSKRCIPLIEEQLEKKDFKIIRFFHKMNLKLLPEEDIEKIDPQMHSFFNVNTPQAFVESQKIAKELRIKG